MEAVTKPRAALAIAGRTEGHSGRRALLLSSFAGLALARPALAQDAPRTLKVVLDAEFSHPSSTSAQAIELGIRIALDEINPRLPAGFPRFALVTADNGAVAAIAQDNFAEHAADPAVIGVFGGKFSPVMIELVPLAHRHRLMLLNPWGSADGITDHGFYPGWSFRLSLKDAWAGPAFVARARERLGAARIGLLLPTTAWGRSNQIDLQAAAAAQDLSIVGTRWFSWGERSLIRRYQELRAAGAQAVVFVTNEQEGAVLVREMAALPTAQRLPLLCHWGITGGQFASLCGPALGQVDLEVIQTFAFHGNDRPQARALLAACLARLPASAGGRVEAPVGVAHGHDLMHIVALAAQQAGELSRGAIRSAMERVPDFAGAVRDYAPPFTAQRHDADLAGNILFARYTENGALVPAP